MSERKSDFLHCRGRDPSVVPTIMLDFARYPIGQDMFFEVESEHQLSRPFGHGYATSRFNDFLNYVIALNLHNDRLYPFRKEAPIPFRFDRLFPEQEKTIIRAVMQLRGVRTDSNLGKTVLESIDPSCVLFGAKTEEQRRGMNLYSLDPYRC